MSEAALSAEVVVIGAGPAGIAAAATAAAAGRDVLLVDEGLRAGGQIWRHRHRAKLPRDARRWLDRLDSSGARTLFGATVVNLSPELHVLLEVGGAPVELTASRAVILCTGARERFIPFPGWTLPGVVGVGGAQALLKAGLKVAGRRVVVAGSGPLLLPVSAALARAGARVALVAEQAPAARVRRFAAGLWRSPARVLDAVLYRSAFLRTPYRTGTWVAAVEGAERVEAARIAGARDPGRTASGRLHRGAESQGRRAGSSAETLPCDLLCVGYGLVPATELPRLVGCLVHDGAVQVDEHQQTSVPGIYCAGEPTGVAGADAAVTQGEIAARAVTGGELPRRLVDQRDAQRRFAARLDAAFALRDELRALASPDTLVCRCEDVTRARLESCSSFREARLHTRIAMGPCQGRVCGPGVEFLYGWTGDSIRPPVTPALVGTLGGSSDPPVSGQPAAG